MDYPRSLRMKERDLLDTVLPGERPGYRRVRELMDRMMVIGPGRRGAGDLILGSPGETPDTESPLPPVIAYGAVESTQDIFTITVREELDRQINVEIVSSHGQEIPDRYEEKRRWTYSLWSPGDPSPATGGPVRGIDVDGAVTIAFAPTEKRIWAHDADSGMVHPIPITNFYHELMVRKGIRDPRIALTPALLWERLDGEPDDDLRSAFVAYNALRARVTLRALPSLPRASWSARLWNFLTGKR
jgi:hypothetical protein